MSILDVNRQSSPVVESAFHQDKPSSAPIDHLPPYHEIGTFNSISDNVTRAQLRLPERLSQELEHNEHPQIVCGTLHGIVRVQVGEYAAQQKFLRLDSNFALSKTSSSIPSSKGSQCNVELSTSQPLPSSGCLIGSTWISETTALSDHRKEIGRCEVSYYFYPNSVTYTNPLHNCYNSVVESNKVRLTITPSWIELGTATVKARRTQVLIQTFTNNISKTFSFSYPSPVLTFKILGDVRQKLQQFKSGNDMVQKLTVPIMASIQLPQPASEKQATSLTLLRHRLLHRGIMDFGTVTATFFTRTRFGVGPSHRDFSVDKREVHVVARNSVINLPPFYEDGDSFIAATELELAFSSHLLHESTVNTDLLQVNHTLSLAIDTKELPAELAAYSANLNTGCSLR